MVLQYEAAFDGPSMMPDLWNSLAVQLFDLAGY